MTESGNAYQVVLRQDAAGRSQLVWHTLEAGRQVEYTREPSRSAWRRLAVRLLSLLPIEDEL